MKVVRCVQDISSAGFIAGNLYEVVKNRVTNGECYLRSDNGINYWTFTGRGAQFSEPFEFQIISEPMFDLEDMELAEILIDEMKK